MDRTSRTRETDVKRRTRLTLRQKSNRHLDADLDAFTATMTESEALTFEVHDSTAKDPRASFKKSHSHKSVTIEAPVKEGKEDDKPTPVPSSTPKLPPLITGKKNAQEPAPPAPQAQEVQLGVKEGTLTVDVSKSGGPTIDPITGSGLILTVSGTEDEINKALKTLRYTAPKK